MTDDQTPGQTSGRTVGTSLPESVPDVVCGKRVNPRATKWQIRHADHTFYFCTLSCALRFKDSPHAFQRRIEHATQN